MSSADGCDQLVVPIFALPNVVLFPRAVLPLHIFEERYKTMTRDALRGERRVAMALLRPGWEKDYYQRPAIEPVVCVGRILAHEKLKDGTYNFLLQGEMRAVVEADVPGLSYRRALVRPTQERAVLEIDLDEPRRRLGKIFGAEPWSRMRMGQQFAGLLESDLRTAQVADLAAFNFLEDVQLKQSLLAEPDVLLRVGRVIEALEGLRPMIEAAAARGGGEPSLN